MKRIITIVLTATLLLCQCLPASAASLDNIPYDSYTYWQEDNGKYLAGSKTMYEVTGTISGEELSIGNIVPSDIATSGNGSLYILDGEHSRIVILSSDGKLVRVINEIGGETFKGASGITVANDGTIYLADTENMRVISANRDGALIRIFTCPDSEIIPDDFEFRPLQITVDSNGYLYVLSKGSFYGALVFDPDGNTEGFFGANSVNTSVSDIIETLWNRWFMTDEQRASQIQKIPYQFSDLCIDEEGLLYTTTGATTTYAAQYGQIRCLGPGGINVMKNRVGRDSVTSDSFNFADNGIASLAVGKRVQNFVSIDVSDGYIYALDQTYGKVYVYSKKCELLTVFGGGVKNGTQTGTFKNASAVAVNGNKLYVADSVKGNITVFTLNEYGNQVKQAALLTDSGDYIKAKPLWEKVHQSDRNNQLAYRGLARSALAEGEYRASMKYAKDGVDRGIYDQAFENVRNDFLEKYIGWILVGLLIITVSLTVLIIRKKRYPSEKKRAPKLKLALKSWLHPFDSFRAVKFSGEGSLTIAGVILVIFYVAETMKDFYSGFAFSDYNAENYNSIFKLIGTVGVVLLWVVCNWAVSVLAEGKAKIKEVFVVTSYSLIPMIFGDIMYLLLSNALLLKEATALTVITTVCMILSGLTLIIGTMVIEEFDFFKFLWTAVCTLLAMAIVFFLAFMIVILLQQFFVFIKTVFVEVTYR